jgi:hypothetical protein
MKQFMGILVAITMTFIITMIFVMVKFGALNVSNHVDHYTTLCNGEVIDERDQVVTDRVTYDISIKESFNIFNR